MDDDDGAEIAALAQVSTADPDHVLVDEADDEGVMAPRSFLGAANSGDGGAAEPLADAGPTPTVVTGGPPALGAAAAAGTPKGWHEKKLSAFDLVGNILTLTTAFVAFFSLFPKPKATPWEEQEADFQNTAHCEEDDTHATGPDGGLNMKYWENLKDHGHDHDYPLPEEIMDPLWLFLHNITVGFWRMLGVHTDRYAAQTYAREETEDITANRTRTRRTWAKVGEGGRWWKLANFFGILVFRGVVHTGDRDHLSAWSTVGYDNNYGFYDERVADCMSQLEFEQFRRFTHFCNNEEAAAAAAAPVRSAALCSELGDVHGPLVNTSLLFRLSLSSSSSAARSVLRAPSTPRSNFLARECCVGGRLGAC